MVVYRHMGTCRNSVNQFRLTEDLTRLGSASPCMAAVECCVCVCVHVSLCVSALCKMCPLLSEQGYWEEIFLGTHLFYNMHTHTHTHKLHGQCRTPHRHL